MKRCLFTYALSILCVFLNAQISNIGLAFWAKYGINGAINTCSSFNNFQTREDINCYNFNHADKRGKEYASLFIPNENTPIMPVRINLIFIQKNDGTGNFQENNIEHQTLFDDIIEEINNKISWLTYPGTECFSGGSENIIQDMRIRFVDYRYYIRKSCIWNNGLHTNNYAHLCPNANSWYLNNLDDSIVNVLPDTLKGINIYFTEDSSIYNHFWEIQNINDTSDVWTGYSTAACSEFPNFQNLQASSRIHMPCLYSKLWYMKNIVPTMGQFHYPSWQNTVRLWLVWGTAAGILHELGHSFNLLHPTDDARYIYPSYPQNDCLYSIMNPAGSSPRNFLPPQEIGLMYFSTMATNLQQFIPKNTYLGEMLLNIPTTLPRMRVLHSLLIGSNGVINMPCDMIFSPLCEIKVQNGGLLSINDANLHSISNQWKGISVLSGGQLLLSNTSISDYDIVIKSGGTLFIKDNLTITNDHSITIEDGGYICIDNNAAINLVDAFSSIIISPNAIMGCSSCNDTCILSRNDLANLGNGHIVTYSGIDYIQNVTISSNYMASGDTVYAGYDVTLTQPTGKVIIENGGNLRIKANETILTKEIEVKLGGSLIIMP